MTHRSKFPQPTTEELEAAPDRWLSFNPYLWRIVQDKIGEIAQEHLWEDYSEAIDEAIVSLMIPHELPEATMPFYGAKMYRTANQSIVNNTVVNITWQALAYDTMGLITLPSTNIVIPATGYYAITPVVAFDTHATGYRQIAILKAGATLHIARLPPVSSGADTIFATHTEDLLTAGDVITISVRQTSGGNLNILSGITLSSCSVVFLGE